MGLRLGVVMDPIHAIKYHKDSTLAMLFAAQRHGWTLFYMEQDDLFLRNGRSFAAMRPLRVMEDEHRWFELDDATEQPLGGLDAVLMRKDPPFDMEYIYTTYMLERAEQEGCLVVNRPQSLRDANEKLFTAWFPQCTPPTLVSRNKQQLRAFIDEQETAILKPLEGMGGSSIFKVERKDPNLSVIIETLTALGSRFIMAQRFLPEIAQGDKRILLVDGQPVPYALARIPAAGEVRGNLAAGGKGVGVPLSPRDQWICDQVGPELRRRGLLFVGLDVIGDYLTEINVTSPTCIRELDKQYGLDIAGDLMNVIAKQVAERSAD